jgi:4,5-DOPA dioxygenase extradiol
MGEAAQEEGARMPVLFVGHGNPMNAISDNPWAKAWQALGASLPRPKAILAVSAHWYMPGSYLTANHDPKTIHDFGGFPPELYQVQYPAPGDPGLANHVTSLLAGSELRSDWGLDHGTWSVLLHMFPKADIPVIQLSIDGHAGFAQHLGFGRQIAPLRDEGVLIVGSGNLTHNLRSAFQKMRTGDQTIPDWSRHFDQEAAHALRQADEDFLTSAPHTDEGRLCHPSPDHYIPVLYAAGAADASDKVTFPVEGFDMGLSMRAVRFG